MTSLLSFVTVLTGLVIYANFWREDPLKCGYIKKPDQLLPYYTVSKLSEYPGIPGLIIAGIFSGSLSTVSSFVNSLSAVTLEDYLKPIFRNSPIFKTNEILITKLLAFGYGCLCICLTYLADKMAGLLQASLTVFGVVGGPLLMLFTVGMCFRFTNSTGAITGFTVSLLFGLWIGFGTLLYGKRATPLPTSDELCRANGTIGFDFMPYFKPTNQEFVPSTMIFYNVSYMWFAALSWLLGVVVALLVSWCTNDNKHKDDNCIGNGESNNHEVSISSALQNSRSNQLENLTIKSKIDNSLLMPLLQLRNDSMTSSNGITAAANGTKAQEHFFSATPPASSTSTLMPNIKNDLELQKQIL